MLGLGDRAGCGQGEGVGGGEEGRMKATSYITGFPQNTYVNNVRPTVYLRHGGIFM